MVTLSSLYPSDRHRGLARARARERERETSADEEAVAGVDHVGEDAKVLLGGPIQLWSSWRVDACLRAVQERDSERVVELQRESREWYSKRMREKHSDRMREKHREAERGGGERERDLVHSKHIREVVAYVRRVDLHVPAQTDRQDKRSAGRDRAIRARSAREYL